MGARFLAVALTSLLAVAVAASACGGKTSGPGGATPTPTPTTTPTPIGVPIDLRITAINAGASAFAPQSHQASFASARTLPADSYLAESILSGPPDEMRVTLLEIDIDDGGPGTVLFSGTAQLLLASGNVDLAAAGVTLQPIPAGHYSHVAATFQRVGQFKGCVRGAVAAHTSNMGTGTGLHGTNVYTSETMVQGTHQYCTIAAHSQLDAETFSTTIIASNATYEAQTVPELVDFDLVANNSENYTQAEIRTKTAQIGQANLDFTVTAGSANTLTMAFDLNRMLRFYANTRSDFNPPNPDMKTGTSYFFTTIFNPANTVLVGAPGSVEGYPVDAEYCGSFNGCTPNAIGKMWLTLIKDGSGNVIRGLVMPNDDNANVLKGNVTMVAAGTTAGTVDLSITGNESISGFRYQSVGAPEDSAMAISSIGATTPIAIFYHREL